MRGTDETYADDDALEEAREDPLDSPDRDSYKDEMWVGDDTLAEEEYTGEGGWWDEGLITLLLVAGVILFVFPEPATSALGVLLVAAGVVVWIVDAVL